MGGRGGGGGGGGGGSRGEYSKVISKEGNKLIYARFKLGGQSVKVFRDSDSDSRDFSVSSDGRYVGALSYNPGLEKFTAHPAARGATNTTHDTRNSAIRSLVKSGSVNATGVNQRGRPDPNFTGFR